MVRPASNPAQRKKQPTGGKGKVGSARQQPSTGKSALMTPEVPENQRAPKEGTRTTKCRGCNWSFNPVIITRHGKEKVVTYWQPCFRNGEKWREDY